MTKAFQTFADFIDIAIRENWCARIGCTTCGSHPFRAALREIPQEDVIVGLRGWSSGFLSNNADMFRLVVLEISDFGVYRVLRDLSGTPAGEQLRNDIDYWHRECERRQDYLASQTPEAIAARRVKKRRTGRYRLPRIGNANWLCGLLFELPRWKSLALIRS